MKVIAGLGNPGQKYAATRHNLGFMVVDAASAKFRARVETRAHSALVGSARVAGAEVILAKPQTFMNLSGRSVGPIAGSAGAAPEEVVVVHDDMDIPFGRLKISVSGGDGGHNGVASVMEALSSASFTRLRVGVGRPPEGVDPVEYVLSPFTPEEKALLDKIVATAVEALASIVREGPARAMNRFNKAPAEEGPDARTGTGDNG